MWKGIYIYIYISCHSVCVAECLWYHVKPYIYITCQSVCDIVHMPSCCDVIPCGFMSFFQSMMTLRDLERHWRVFYPWCPCDILRDPERPWGTMRDIDVFFWHSEGPWETLRDVERPWGTLRDWFFLKVWGTLSVLERPWGTWETLRKFEKLFERTFRKPWGNLRNSFWKITWETLRELERLWGNWKNYIWGKPLSIMVLLKDFGIFLEGCSLLETNLQNIRSHENGFAHIF